MKFVLPSHRGGMVLMMLVIFGMILVMATSVIFFSQRQLKATVDQEQTERSFQVTEAGVQYALFLLNSRVYNTEELLELPPIERDLDDDLFREDSGAFRISFAAVSGAPAGSAVQVTSQGRDSAAKSCQQVVATIRRLNNEFNLYGVTTWDHVPACD